MSINFELEKVVRYPINCFRMRSRSISKN